MQEATDETPREPNGGKTGGTVAGTMSRMAVTTLVYAIDDDRLLLLERNKEPNAGLWSPPGGKLEPGETPLRGAVRELREETGLDGLSPRLVAVVCELDEQDADAWLMFIVRVDVARTAPLRSSPEGAAAWVPIRDLGELATPPADRHITEVVLDDGPGVAFMEVRMERGRLLGVRVERA